MFAFCCDTAPVAQHSLLLRQTLFFFVRRCLSHAGPRLIQSNSRCVSLLRILRCRNDSRESAIMYSGVLRGTCWILVHITLEDQMRSIDGAFLSDMHSSAFFGQQMGADPARRTPPSTLQMARTQSPQKTAAYFFRESGGRIRSWVGTSRSRMVAPCWMATPVAPLADPNE